MAVLPLYNTVLLPDTDAFLQTNQFQALAGKTPVEGERVTIVVPKTNQPRSKMDSDSFQPIGITGTVTEVNPGGYLIMRLQNRVDVNGVDVLPDRSISLEVSRRADVDDLDRDEAARRLEQVRGAVVSYTDNFPWGPTVRSFARHWDSVAQIAVALSPWLDATPEDRYALLEQDSTKARAEMAERVVYEFVESSRVQTEAASAQEEDQKRLYRENALRKQIDFLQKQLDEMHPEELSDIRRLEIALEESPMSEEARAEGRRVLSRLKNGEGHGAEAGMLTDYLELLCDLPWARTEPDAVDLARAREILDADHCGLDKVKRRILQQLAVMALSGRQSGSILLFVGAPGTGKTSIGASIARALGREYVRVSLGGVRDEADIRGHRRTYIGSMPGRIIDGIHKAGVSNPVMVLDEVDKLSSSYNGDPASALLEVLDPEQNSTFTDHYLNVPFDLSDVLFVCTANTMDTIPAPLLDRMEVIKFSGYTPLEKVDIAREHLIPDAMQAAGIDAGALEITDEALDAIIEQYTHEAGVRGLKKRVDTLCRSAAVDIVSARALVAQAGSGTADTTALPQAAAEEGTVTAGADAGASEPVGIESASTETSSPVVRVTCDNLRELLDAHPLHRKRVRDSAQPGVVTGLAWTGAGGDVLYIETMLTKGSGKVAVTGQLGDVMKESTQIAVSLVKSAFPEHAQLFEDNDLHIHVPDGSTPKDGPSAGITLTCALASLVTGIAVTPHVAMTGEVSLQGRVNPIGGLPEKLMAAQRAGVERVFIPVDNVDDLDEVAPEVLEAIEVTPVETVNDVLTALGLVRQLEVAA